MTKRNNKMKFRYLIQFLAVLLLMLIIASPVLAGEHLYSFLSGAVRGDDAGLFEDLNLGARDLDWSEAQEKEFEGNLRFLESETLEGSADVTNLFLVRDINSDLYILSIPTEEEMVAKGVVDYYQNLDGMLEDKLNFNVKVVEGTIDGETYSFARFLEKPDQVWLDRIFKTSIVIMLFMVMVGMGLTLTMNDFRLVFKKPKAIITGAALQWLVMPLVAVVLGRLLGFYETFPFIFVGMVLITVSPGGVTSNLMTYYGKGDLALSVSLTSFSTVFSLFFTPFLLALYCANVPDITVPTGLIIQTIIVLVLVPLLVGMGVRAKWENLAKKATPFFSALGIIALLFLIGAGILSNLDKFADTARYGFTFYSMVLGLTFTGILLGILIPKILKISNYQIRAISLENGLRNSSLAMALALLIQDFMGDFFSSMFVTSAMFGLGMYIGGFAAVYIFKFVLPLDKDDSSEDKALPGSSKPKSA